jgi:drug/metabolite transporter (DMT)-like permease
VNFSHLAVDKPHMKMPSKRALQLTGLICGLVGTVFLGYTLNYIDRLPNGDGSGFKWMMSFLLYGIWMLFCLPAMLLSPVKKVAMLSAGFGIVAIVSYALLWSEFLFEFSRYWT